MSDDKELPRMGMMAPSDVERNNALFVIGNNLFLLSKALIFGKLVDKMASDEAVAKTEQIIEQLIAKK